MSTALKRLQRILELEAKQGHLDRAVFGGLKGFLAFWQRQAKADDAAPGSGLSADEVAERLAGYGQMSVAEREQAISALLSQIAQASGAGDSESQPPALTAATQEAPLVKDSDAGASEPTSASAQGAAKATVHGAGTVTQSSQTGPDEAHEAESPANDAQAFVDVPESIVETAAVKVIEPGVQTVESVAAPPPPSMLHDPVTALKGIGPAKSETLARLGIETVEDLLYHLPSRYDDYSQLRPISDLAAGEQVTVVGVIREVRQRKSRNGRALVTVVLGDTTGTIEATWFGQTWLGRSFKVGEMLVVSGHAERYLGRLTFQSPDWEPLRPDQLHTHRLVPIYPLTEGLGPKQARRMLRDCLDQALPGIVDPLPDGTRQRHHLVGLARALDQIHFPDNVRARDQARRRLCFDELLDIQVGVLERKTGRQAASARALDIPQDDLDAFVNGLPYELTGAQQWALDEIIEDLAKDRPMARLLQGDVGSGKTVVAVAAILAAVRNGLQAALMAPTSVLAEQHFATVSELLGRHGVSCGLLVGSMSESDKRQMRERIAVGHVQVAIGTHALIQESVDFRRLGLAIVDEQHRFGVSQREALRGQDQLMPHVLVMSATPIPRSLALTLYGDLDVSTIDEMPPGRQTVVTAVRGSESREQIYAFVDSQVRDKAHQVFVICPLVEEGTAEGGVAVVSEAKRLQEKVFPYLRIGLLHGRMHSDEKDRVMRAFREQEYDILVSTSVIEVGIDIPNATVIMIEGADRFGLAQLHQFRGRVGRGNAKSYCILMSDGASETGLTRLHLMEQISNGFELAEKDLEMRGPGEFFGVRQSGLPRLRVAQLGDKDVLLAARDEAMRLLESDPDLDLPQHTELKDRVERFWSRLDLS